MAKPRKIVTLCLFMSLVIILTNKAVNEQFPKPRVFLGLAIAFIMIGFGAEFAPELAAYFAILFLVSLTLTEGADTFSGISKALGGK